MNNYMEAIAQANAPLANATAIPVASLNTRLKKNTPAAEQHTDILLPAF